MLNLGGGGFKTSTRHPSIPRLRGGEELGLWNQTVSPRLNSWLLVISCVSPGKCLSLSEPMFSLPPQPCKYNSDISADSLA